MCNTLEAASVITNRDVDDPAIDIACNFPTLWLGLSPDQVMAACTSGHQTECAQPVLTRFVRFVSASDGGTQITRATDI